MENLNTYPGKPFPLGTEVKCDGVNFSVFSRNGTSVTIDFFHNSDDIEPFASVNLDPKINRTGDLWHVFVKGIQPGTLYLYKVDGPFEPTQGHRFNKNQYLLDPYAKAITPVSLFMNLPPAYVTPVDKLDIELSKNRKFAKFPKCVVVSDDFDWEGDKPINRPMKDTIIYETHLKGFTAGKGNGVSCPGTYHGFMERLPYLKDLGITAVELMPIEEFDEFENTNVNPRTGERMENYWGYSTMSFFAPKANFAADKTPGGCVREFKQLIKEMHKNGIEVILDIVFNHTAEGNEHGITFGFRGFDNTLYYLLVDSNKEYYMNFSGCGNTVNCNHPVVRQWIIDCLRYWVLEYHIDGFRFDLATILSRSQQGYLINFPPVLNAINEDPVLAKTKIIAEPWDAAGGYQVGWFPGGKRWAEWNDRYRDDMRRFWRGDEHMSTAAATRFSGSSDIYSGSGRKPWNSVNYITSHDGFTLNDLVSYNSKHNEQNGENNRDGTDNNNSYNYGYEGATANPAIERIRTQQIKNFLLSLLISQGTPMLLGGDEMRRGQQGNNNAYCQDNEISWFDWNNAGINGKLLMFTKRAIALRKNHAVFRRENFFSGQKENGVSDIQWVGPDGSNPDWEKLSRFLAFRLGGACAKNEDGKQDNDFYVAANTDKHDVNCQLPTLTDGKKWYRVADTSIDAEDSICEEGKEELLHAQSRYIVPGNSLVVLIAR